MDVTLPDGKVISNVPDGTTKQQLIDKLAANGYDTTKLGLTSNAQAFRPSDALTSTPSVAEQFLGGAKHAWDKGAQGLKEILPTPVQEAGDWLEQKLTGSKTDLPALTRQGEAFVKETGPASTVGEIGGQVALTAAPATRVFRAVAGANPALLRSGAAAASSGAVPAAVLTPGDYEERGKAAAYDAAGGVLGEAGGRVFKRALTGLVTPSESAKKLMAHGVQPTVGQGAASSFIHGAEDLTAGIPVVGQIVRAGQRRAQKEAAEQFLTQGIPIDQFPPELMQRLNTAPTLREKVEALGDMSRHIYETTIPRVPPIEVTPAFKLTLGDMRNTLPQGARRDVEEVLATHLGDKVELSGQQLHDLTTELGEVAQDFLTSERASDKRAGRAIQAMQGRLKEMFFGDALKEVDDAYANLARIRRAGSYVGTSEGLAPSHMERAVRAESGRTQFAEGAGRMQNLSDPAQILKTSPNSGLSLLATGGAAGLAHLAGLSPAALTAAIAATIGSTKHGAAAAFGNTDIQRAMAEVLRQLPAAPATIGAAIADKRKREPRTLNEY